MALITATHVLLGPNTGRSIKRCRQLREASFFFQASEQNPTGLQLHWAASSATEAMAQGLT